MDSTLILVATSFSALALGCAAISLALHYARRNEHPAITQLKADQLDLLDKVEHWIKRDRVRRLRASQETPVEEPTEAPAQGKNALRLAARSRGFHV